MRSTKPVVFPPPNLFHNSYSKQSPYLPNLIQRNSLYCIITIFLDNYVLKSSNIKLNSRRYYKGPTKTKRKLDIVLNFFRQTFQTQVLRSQVPYQQRNLPTISLTSKCIDRSAIKWKDSIQYLFYAAGKQKSYYITDISIVLYSTMEVSNSFETILFQKIGFEGGNFAEIISL